MTRRNKRIDLFMSIDMSAGPKACWPFKGKLNSKGRPYFTVGGQKFIAYRLAYELVHGEGSLDGLMARHTCDNEVCCNPHHIVKGEHQENMNDMKERERHGMPHHVVRAIRKLADKGMSHQEIADLYGKGRSTITEAINGTQYSHVKDEENEVSTTNSSDDKRSD
jgi:hypothetical protein